MVKTRKPPLVKSPPQSQPKSSQSDKVAILKIAGKQYKVSEGQKIEVDHLKKKKDEKFIVEDLLRGSKIAIRVLDNKKGRKVVVSKFRPKTRYKRLKGFRPLKTVLQVEKIS